jgi:hypothetical protein
MMRQPAGQVGDRLRGELHNPTLAPGHLELHGLLAVAAPGDVPEFQCAHLAGTQADVAQQPQDDPVADAERELCPGLFSEVVPPDCDADIFAWRQLAWDNAQRLLAAPTANERERIARQIRRHAKDKAREILRWSR